jgi:hypothetical protein
LNVTSSCFVTDTVAFQSLIVKAASIQCGPIMFRLRLGESDDYRGFPRRLDAFLGICLFHNAEFKQSKGAEGYGAAAGQKRGNGE